MIKIKRINEWWQVGNEGIVIEFRGLDSACLWMKMMTWLDTSVKAISDCRVI